MEKIDERNFEKSVCTPVAIRFFGFGLFRSCASANRLECHFRFDLAGRRYIYRNVSITNGGGFALEGVPSAPDFQGVQIHADNITVGAGSAISGDRPRLWRRCGARRRRPWRLGGGGGGYGGVGGSTPAMPEASPTGPPRLRLTWGVEAAASNTIRPPEDGGRRDPSPCQRDACE